MSDIEQFAFEVLEQKELEFAKHLAFLLGDNTYNPQPLVEKFIPIYWESGGDIDVSLSPDNIYRPLYYIHMHSSDRNFKENTRYYMTLISAHLEGCLKNLIPSLPQNRTTGKEPFGALIKPLKESGIISEKLASYLKRFNDIINIPAKHFSSYIPTRKLSERTFSVLETAYALILMSKLSKELFAILKSRGVRLPQEWPEFKEEWLSYSPKI